ncbi:hypothetical protein J2X97_000462 [Epilithonimonas hungarica]|nr:hypothetical protein [Epilithonimonas hungarica]
MGGISSGDGNGDISGIDGGFSEYQRLYFELQTLPTDEAVIAWTDAGLPDLHSMTWSSSNQFVSGMYYRIYSVIAHSNNFIANTSDAKLAENGITGANLDAAKIMRTEARFVRAQSYEHLLDLFGNVPFVDETFAFGSGNLPKRIERKDLFNWVEAELLACANELKDPKTNQYGRVDKAAAWSLLARLYLNAQVYSGTNRWNDCVTYCNKVLQSGYSLKTDYKTLFNANNDQNNPEVIFAVPFDGTNIQSNGGSTFMIHASVGGKMVLADSGITTSGWGGLRVTKSFVNLFPTDGSDKRGRFFTTDQNLEINNVSTFTDGYAFYKYTNLTNAGTNGKDGNFCDADIPLYRLADVYLMYAEATLRGGNGDMTTALGYINNIRTRAGASTVSSINLDFILQERSRELSWEATRRSDLIRYGRFTSSSYLWPWKGGSQNGVGVGDFRSLYPIPANEIIANPNLVQNSGY